MLLVRPTWEDGKAIKITSRAAGASVVNGEFRIPLLAVEVGIGHSLPEAGAVTSQLKVIDQQASPHSLHLRLSAPAGSSQILFLRVNDPKVRLRAEGGEVSSDSTQLRVQFTACAGYVEKTVSLSW